MKWAATKEKTRKENDVEWSRVMEWKGKEVI